MFNNSIQIKIDHCWSNDYVPDENDLKEIRCKLNSGEFVDRDLPYEELEEKRQKIIFDKYKGFTDRVNCHDITAKLSDENSCLKVIHGYLAIRKIPKDLSKKHYIWHELNQLYFYLKKDLVDELEHGQYFDSNRHNIINNHYEVLVNRQHGLSRIRLSHHSVLLDNQGRYIECVYERYPLAGKDDDLDYIFIPHLSGQLGCSLVASFKFS